MALTLLALPAACDGDLSGEGHPPDNPFQEPSLRVGVELSTDHITAGESLTVTVVATNLGSDSPLHDVNVLLPVATGDLRLVDADGEGADEHAPPAFDARNNMFSWRIPQLAPGASVRHTVVLESSGPESFAAYNGILGFARNEQGPLDDNGAMNAAVVHGLEADPGFVDLEMVEHRPPTYRDNGDVELSFRVTNQDTEREAHGVRIVGCLDPSTDFAIDAGQLQPIGENQRCFMVGYSRVAPQEQAFVRFLMRMRQGITEVPERLFTSVFITAEEPDSALHNNWAVVATDRQKMQP